MKILRSVAIKDYDRPDLPFQLSWSLTGKCLYKCSYCYEGESEKRAYEPELSLLLLAMERLKPVLASVAPERKLKFRLFGGEPLAHKNFLPFLSALAGNFPAAVIACLSNAFRPISFFEKIVEIVPNFQFSFSVHFESLKEDVFLEKLRFLKSRNLAPHLSLQFVPAQRKRVREFADTLRSEFPDFSLAVQFLRSRESNFREHCREYTAEDYAWAKSLKKAGGASRYFVDYLDDTQKICRKTFYFEDAFCPEFSNFKGAFCTWNMLRLTLNEKGWLYTGFCLPRPRVNLYEKNFQQSDFNLFRPAVCPRDFCACSGMREAAKFYEPAFAPIYLGGTHPAETDLNPS